MYLVEKRINIVKKFVEKNAHLINIFITFTIVFVIFIEDLLRFQVSLAADDILVQIRHLSISVFSFHGLVPRYTYL